MQTSQQTKLRTFIKTKATQVHRHRQVGFSGLFGEGPPTPSKQRYAQLTCFAYTMMRTLFSPTSLSLSLVLANTLLHMWVVEGYSKMLKLNKQKDRQTDWFKGNQKVFSFFFVLNKCLVRIYSWSWLGTPKNKTCRSHFEGVRSKCSFR